MNRHQQILLKNSLYKSIKADECVDFDPNWIETGGILKCIKPLSQEDNAENDRYFYHSDHIGSSSFITDNSGIACQHLQYLPFGELFVEQQSTANYYTPYKFSGKEKDEETSYSYFGARYYMSDVSVWLSVDPLAEKFPNVSPYNYCHLNPVMLTDPDGMDDGWYLPEGGGHSVYDKDVNSQKDLNDKGIKGQYQGKQGVEIAENGQIHLMNKDGAEKFITPVLPGVTVSASRINKNSNSNAPWMDYAQREIGQKEGEVYGNPTNKRIVEYVNSTGLKTTSDKKYAWCAAFVNWSLKQAGIKGAGARGNDYLNWGEPLDEPEYGAVAVFKTGHVGFYAGRKGKNYKILHGNWGNKVELSNYIKPSEINKFRFPKSYRK